MTWVFGVGSHRMFVDWNFKKARRPTNSNALLTALSSDTTSCFGLHKYDATWNLEGIKSNTCNRTLITET